MTDLPSGLPLLIDRLASALGRDHVDLSQPPHIRCVPGSASEVVEVLTCASLGQVAVTCHGEPAALLHLDLSRLSGLSAELPGSEAISEISLLCEVQAGTLLLALEQVLNERRLTLGPLPPRSYTRLLGAALAAPRPAEASLLLGRLRDRVLRLSAVLPSPLGEALLPVALAPRRATGPDLKQLLIGSEGRLGVITAAALQVAPRPVETRCRGWLFDTAVPAAGVLHEALLLHGGTGLADAQIHSRGYLRRALGADPPPGEVALLLRCDTLPELAPPLLARLAALAEAAGGREMAEPMPVLLLGVDAVGNPQRRFALAAAAPIHEEALPRLSARALAERLAAALAGGAAVLLCGVHQHGAALCTDVAAAHADEGTELLQRLRRRLGSGLLR